MIRRSRLARTDHTDWRTPRVLLQGGIVRPVQRPFSAPELPERDAPDHVHLDFRNRPPEPTDRDDVGTGEPD